MFGLFDNTGLVLLVNALWVGQDLDADVGVADSSVRFAFDDVNSQVTKVVVGHQFQLAV